MCSYYSFFAQLSDLYLLDVRFTFASLKVREAGLNINWEQLRPNSKIKSVENLVALKWTVILRYNVVISWQFAQKLNNRLETTRQPDRHKDYGTHKVFKGERARRQVGRLCTSCQHVTVHTLINKQYSRGDFNLLLLINTFTVCVPTLVQISHTGYGCTVFVTSVRMPA